MSFMPRRPALGPLSVLRQSGPPSIPVPVARAVIDCAVYVDGIRSSEPVSFDDALSQVRNRGEGFVWLGLHAPDLHQMATVAEAFGLHELVVEDAVNALQRPKLEVYDDMTFMVLRTVRYIDHGRIEIANEIVESGEIMLIIGPDYVITVRHGDHSHLSGVRHRLEARPDRLALGPDAVLHAVADEVVDNYLEVVTEMESDVDELEEWVFGSTRAIDINPVYLMRRETLELNRAVSPLTGPLAELTAGGADALIPEKEVRRLFRDVQDHLTRVTELVGDHNERLATLMNAAATKVSIQQNTDMRKISAWVAIAAVPTMVAGIYGMNFEYMPELDDRWAYPTVLGALAACCIVLFIVFRRHHWL